MGSLKRAGDILPFIFEFKDCIVIESENSGKIIIPQDLLNNTMKKFILSKWDMISDFNCDFYSGEITITKKVLLLNFSVKLYSLNFIINRNEYKISAKHSHSNALCIFNFIGVLPSFISATEEEAEIDFTKIDGFEKLKKEGVFGIDIFNTIELSFESFKDGILTFSYWFI